MTRFTKADLDSEAYAQKLNQMLWGRCKAGKINQSEYTALVENRDVNLKRLIAEKNLTLEEARHVRSLIMEQHLTMTLAIDVAKEKISLAQARQSRSSRSAAPLRSTRFARKPTDKKGKTSPTPRSSKGPRASQSASSPRQDSETRSQNSRPNPPQHQEPEVNRLPQDVRSQGDKPSFNSNSSSQRNPNERRRPLRFRPGNRHQNQPLPERKESKNQEVQQESHSASLPERGQKKDRFNRSGRPFKRNSRPERSYRDREQSSPRSDFRRSEQRLPEQDVLGSEVDYNRTCQEGESPAREWRDWREERNLQIRSKQTGKVLPPIPPGQDWYPGMGFRPSESEPVAKTVPEKPVEKFPIPSSEKSPDFTGAAFHSPGESPEHIATRPLVEPSPYSANAGIHQSASQNHGGGKQRFSGRSFSKGRRFVPRKGGFKRPAH